MIFLMGTAGMPRGYCGYTSRVLQSSQEDSLYRVHLLIKKLQVKPRKLIGGNRETFWETKTNGH